MKGISLSISCLLLVAIGCAGTSPPTSPEDYLDGLRDSIRAEIPEALVQAQLISATDDLQRVLERYEHELEAAQQHMARVNARHDATRADLQVPVDEMAEARDRFLEKVVEIRLGMRAKVSRSQWDAIAGKGFLAKVGLG